MRTPLRSPRAGWHFSKYGELERHAPSESGGTIAIVRKRSPVPPDSKETLTLRVFPQGCGPCVDTHHSTEEEALDHGDTHFA